MVSTAASFEAVVRSENDVAREQATASRVRLSVAAICGVLAVGALLAFMGGAGNASKFLKGGTGTVKLESQLQSMIDDNNKQIEPLQKEVDDLLGQKDYGALANKLHKLQLLVDQNARNEELRKKVEQAQEDLLAGKYPHVDTAIDSIIFDKCNATTMTQINQLKIDAKNATDSRDLDKVVRDLSEIKLLWPTCKSYSQENETADGTRRA